MVGLIAGEAAYQEFVLDSTAKLWLIIAGVIALAAIGLGFVMMKGVLAKDTGTEKMGEIVTDRLVENFVELARRCGEWDRVLQRAQGSVVICCVGPVTGGTARAAGMRAAIEPTSPRLGAMVQALSSAFAQRSTTLQLNRLPVHVQGRLVAVGGAAPVRLTDRERAVFDALVRHPGAVVSKRALVDRVWAGAVDEHVVEVTVARLRKRLGAAGASIATVLRRGYRLDVDPWETPR